jgi:hypothetical protein
LDAKDAGWRAHRHTEAVFEALGTKEMWDDYGIIDDIMVSSNHITIVTLLIRLCPFPPPPLAIHSWISEGGYT